MKILRETSKVGPTADLYITRANPENGFCDHDLVRFPVRFVP